MTTQDAQTVFMRGCGDLGSGVAVALVKAGYRVVAIERPRPTTLRWRVAFAAAALEGRVSVAGVEGVHVTDGAAVADTLAAGKIAVWTGDEAALREHLSPDILVDARLRGLSDPNLSLADAPLVIALGPGYVARERCDYVIETNRGPRLGAILEEGRAEAHTGIPGQVAGQTARRLLRSPVAGVFQRVRDIGDLVEEGEIVATVEGEPVRAGLAGMVRGLMLSGHRIPRGKKVGDVDPRGPDTRLDEPTDKAGAVGAAVVAAVRRGAHRAR